jgi:branched-subunit amino acid transport protein
MKHNYWIYLLIMFGVTYLTRVAPLVIFRKKIQSRFIRSFLYYIPYAVLAAMTFPAALYATGHISSAAVGLLVGGFFSLIGKGLTFVAVVSCVSALAVELILKFVL